jgi:hypothetical protein
VRLAVLSNPSSEAIRMHHRTASTLCESYSARKAFTGSTVAARRDGK